MVTGDNATSKAVPSLMTIRVSLRETLGPKKFPGWSCHPDPPTASPKTLPLGVIAGSSRGQIITGGLRWTLLLAEEDAWLNLGPAS